MLLATHIMKNIMILKNIKEMEGEISITQSILPEGNNSKDISLNKEDKGNNSPIILLECLEGDFSVPVILLVDIFDDIYFCFKNENIKKLMNHFG